MATLQELQTALDKKTFDPSKLSKEQEAAVDYALESGQLKGYKNVAEIKRERKIGAAVVAKEKEKRAQPFTTATEGMVPLTDTGIERKDMELFGDVTGGFAVYLKDSPKVVASFRQDPKMGGIDKMKAMQMDLTKMEKLFRRVPGGRALPILKNTAGYLGRMLDGFRTVGLRGGVLRGKAAPGASQLLQTEIKAQAASAAGAGAGSILYDVANMATDFENAVNKDLGEISRNDVEKLPYADQVLVHSAEAMRNALFFNAFGSALMPIMGTMMRGLKGPLGIGTPEAKEMAELAASKGIKMDISSLASEKGLFGKFVNTFWKTIGVFPTVGFFKKRQRKIVEQQALRGMLDEIISQAPIEHQSFLSAKFLNLFKDNYKLFVDQYKVNYNQVSNIADALGNPNIIPTAKLKEKARGFVDVMKSQYSREMQQADILAKQGTTDLQDPIFTLANAIDDIGETMTPKQYQGFFRMLWNAANNSKMEGFADTFFNMSTALKEDFYKVGNKDNLQSYLGSTAFKDKYTDILESSGKQAADEYAKKMTLGLSNFHDELTKANQFFSQRTMTFNSAIANQIKNTDANIFSTKGILNITKEGRVPVQKMFDSTIKNFYKNGDANTIKQFRDMIDAGRPGLGEELFNRGRSLYLWESILKGFKKAPGIPQKPFFEMMDEARRMGVVNLKYSDEMYEMTGTRAREELKSIDAQLANKYKIGEIPQRDILAGLKDAGEFSVKDFKESLGYRTDADRGRLLEKFTEMYGGGKKGQEAGENLLKLVDILDKEFSTEIADVSTFMSRRFVLGGLGAISGAVGAGLAAGPAGVIAFGVLAGGGGYALSNPQALKYLLDVYTDFERLDRAGKISSATFPKSVYRLLNWAASEDKDFPNVDPKKIDFEEVTNYLYNKNILLPQLGFDPNVLRRSDREQMFPEEQVVRTSSSEDAARGVNYLMGSNNGAMKADAVVNYIPPAPNNVAVASRQMTGMPQVPQVPQAPTLPNQNRAQLTQALFPNDPYSLAIAQQQVNRNA